ncbi:MAG: hypothetical protein ACTHOG_05170 [Marmoricola sp.]
MVPLPVGPITRNQLVELGLSDTAILSLLRRRSLRPIFRGVYVAAHVVDSLPTRAEAAALILGPDQVVCDRAAAYLHGVDAYGVRESHVRPLETCVRRGGTPTRHRGIDGRQRDLADRDVMAIGRLCVTTPMRTALDLGCSLPRYRALGVMDELARRHRLDPAAMAIECRRFARRRGVVQLRELVPLVHPEAESPQESRLRLTLHDAGLPEPTLQWWVLEDGVPIFRLDLAYPEHKVAVEYDGEEFHRRTQEQIEADRHRRAWLAQRGWTVIVVTSTELGGGHEDEWLSRLREALRPQTQRFRWELGKPHGSIKCNLAATSAISASERAISASEGARSTG